MTSASLWSYILYQLFCWSACERIVTSWWQYSKSVTNLQILLGLWILSQLLQIEKAVSNEIEQDIAKKMVKASVSAVTKTSIKMKIWKLTSKGLASFSLCNCLLCLFQIVYVRDYLLEEFSSVSKSFTEQTVGIFWWARDRTTLLCQP